VYHWPIEFLRDLLVKICHAFLFFSIKYAGGTSDLMYKICKAQVKAGHQPTVYSGDYKFDVELARELKGVKFKVVKSFFDKFGFSLMPGLLSLTRRDIKNYDVVHMHVFRTFQNVILYYFCKKYKVPFIIDAHGAVPYYKNKKRLKWLFDLVVGKRMLRDAACLVAETKVGVEEYKAIDSTIDDSKIKILSPPFDVDEFQQLPASGQFRAKYGLENKKIVMFFGRINYIKGIDFLVKGFAQLVKKRADVCLAIVGSDDGFLAELKKLIAELKIEDKVIFTGFLSGSEKIGALVDADIVVQTSRSEQGAWAPFEAVLCGTPIIVTAHTGAGEDVRKIDAGYLVKFDDNAGLAQQIEYILSHYEQAKEKTMKAKCFIEENLSMDKRGGEYIEIYKIAGSI
jgi:glycosyltransferase involved in cell wall biosynthesis